MEQIFISILESISREMPELSLVDEDYGQLETEGDTYPVTFPCALVGNMEADWEDIGMGTQKGVVTLTARLAIDCYDDTHLGSNTTEKAAGRLRMANRLYAALQCSVHSNDMGPMYRTKSRYHSLPGMVKVYEYVFQFELHDDSAAEG